MVLDTGKHVMLQNIKGSAQWEIAGNSMTHLSFHSVADTM